MEHALQILKVLGRIVTILPLALFATLYMGKRSIGELPVFDFLVVITLGAVVGADIADPKVNHIYTAIAIIAIALLQKLVATWKIKNRKIGRLLTFEPTMVIYQGQFLVNKMKKIQYPIDTILQMLREQQIFNVKDVELAIVEANGYLSVKLYPEKEVARIEHIPQPNVFNKGIDVPVVIDGQIYEKVLYSRNLNESWLYEELERKNIFDVKDVFYAAINDMNELHVSMKNTNNLQNLPPILH
ncbi:DUF421 domain-containing protein [Bacillus sp. DTU_2020_1000418_1_SI_GHA_SEK_038]|uniref:DUF421 domain-containing protein n=1 Tax=Bacillus sp. DTU_2020_1000418_1_SI_GHA_SEK_038 TaxID=3077585 RepID=UPI0028F0BF9C|nr:DUF421 domain-containing protein [Bacillus sp. DTU_2020_1000418_1_SI_GHA_SEK_038]WNS76450.1 DUF421 domain-containing protein [Bacillus sp. DTU_2020_1000418_1_SI_GHA_SEK_038]